MSSDRELLELAAKAAGMRVYWMKFCDQNMDTWFGFREHGVFGQNTEHEWNPIADDGDALRLAVKLRIEPKQVGVEAWAVAAGEICKIEDIGADPYAATRRAIVRAAAEIGRALP